jgi:heat shock 70kDa protein 1/2/6/8
LLLLQENYVYSVKNTLSDANVSGKIDPADKEKLETMVKDAIEWIEANQLAEEEEFEHQRKELESVASPVFAKLYQGGAGGEAAGGMPGGGMPGAAAAGGPTVEEVD